MKTRFLSNHAELEYSEQHHRQPSMISTATYKLNETDKCTVKGKVNEHPDEEEVMISSNISYTKKAISLDWFCLKCFFPLDGATVGGN